MELEKSFKCVHSTISSYPESAWILHGTVVSEILVVIVDVAQCSKPDNNYTFLRL